MCLMCVKVRASQGIIYTRSTATVYTNKAEHRRMRWGVPYGLNILSNMRSDKFDTTWKGLSVNRCVLSVESFFEKQHEFVGMEPLLLACLYTANNQFAILTGPSDKLVSPYHNRMPIIISMDIVTGKQIGRAHV